MLLQMVEEEKEKLNGINQDNNNSSSSSSSFISIDEEKNITVEELISPIPSPPPLEEINNKLAPIPEESEPEPELPESPALIATVEPEPELPPLITTVEPEPVPELPVPVLKVPIKKKVGLTDGITSMLENLYRLIFCDMFRFKKKGT